MDELDLVRQGDRDARDRWVAAWWPRVYRMALAMAGRPADAEDLAQETMMAALSAVARFRGEAAESTWLYAILRRIYGRRPWRPPVARQAEEMTGEPAADDAVALLATLPPDQRLVAALFYVEDRSVREISAALGVPGATVRWRLFRARQKLRRALGRRPTAMREIL